jgi:hypothetical protein
MISYIPLLLLPLPLSLSPVHLVLLLILTYFLNRPCIYCSFLLIILFASSCHWSGRCIVDFSSQPATSSGPGHGYTEWFTPRIYSSRSKGDWQASNPVSNGSHLVEGDTGLGEFLSTAINHTISALGGAVLEDTRSRLGSLAPLSSTLPESAGIGLGWLRSLLGRSEWTLPCVDVKVRL